MDDQTKDILLAALQNAGITQEMLGELVKPRDKDEMMAAESESVHDDLIELRRVARDAAEPKVDQELSDHRLEEMGRSFDETEQGFDNYKRQGELDRRIKTENQRVLLADGSNLVTPTKKATPLSPEQAQEIFEQKQAQGLVHFTAKGPVVLEPGQDIPDPPTLLQMAKSKRANAPAYWANRRVH